MNLFPNRMTDNQRFALKKLSHLNEAFAEANDHITQLCTLGESGPALSEAIAMAGVIADAIRTVAREGAQSMEATR